MDLPNLSGLSFATDAKLFEHVATRGGGKTRCIKHTEPIVTSDDEDSNVEVSSWGVEGVGTTTKMRSSGPHCSTLKSIRNANRPVQCQAAQTACQRAINAGSPKALCISESPCSAIVALPRAPLRGLNGSKAEAEIAGHTDALSGTTLGSGKGFEPRRHT